MIKCRRKKKTKNKRQIVQLLIVRDTTRAKCARLLMYVIFCIIPKGTRCTDNIMYTTRAVCSAKRKRIVFFKRDVRTRRIFRMFQKLISVFAIDSLFRSLVRFSHTAAATYVIIITTTHYVVILILGQQTRFTIIRLIVLISCVII